MSLKSEIGKTAGPYQDHITSARITNFCKAIGAKEREVAPPTFLTIFRKGEFDLFQDLNLELSRVLHAEQEYFYENPIVAGDQVEFVTELTQVLEKQSTSAFMQFLTFETRVQVKRDHKTVPSGKSRTLVVVRDQTK